MPAIFPSNRAFITPLKSLTLTEGFLNVRIWILARSFMLSIKS